MNRLFGMASAFRLARHPLPVLGFACGIALLGGPAHAAPGATGDAVAAVAEATVAPPTLVFATSRKVHASAGTFDLTLAPAPSAPTIEPRQGGAGGGHAIVFTFGKPVTGGTAAITAGTATAGAPTFAGNQMIVPLSAVANARYVTVSVSDVASADGGIGGSASARLAFLAGDIDQNRTVAQSDLLAANVVLAQPATATSYLRDVNLSGTLSLADALFVVSNFNTTLPGPPTCTITPSQTVPAKSVVLALSNCTAPSGGALSYSWTVGTVGGTPVGTAASYTTPYLSTTTTYWATVTADGQSTSYSTTVTITTPNLCGNYSTRYLGDLGFDGTRVVVQGMTGTTVAYGRITIPNPLPAGWAGKTAPITVFEYGGGSVWKKSYLSKTACDFSATGFAASQGVVNNFYMVFGTVIFSGVAVKPGEVWYLNIKHENYFGEPSCQTGLVCDFALTVFPPG